MIPRPLRTHIGAGLLCLPALALCGCQDVSLGPPDPSGVQTPLPTFELILVADPLVVEVGSVSALTVIGELTDGTEYDVTDQVTWINNSPSVVSIVPGPPASAVALVPGSASIVAGLVGQLSNPVILTVPTPTSYGRLSRRLLSGARRGNLRAGTGRVGPLQPRPRMGRRAMAAGSWGAFLARDHLAFPRGAWGPTLHPAKLGS